MDLRTDVFMTEDKTICIFFIVDSFLKRIDVLKNKGDVIKVAYLVKNGGKIFRCFHSP